MATLVEKYKATFTAEEIDEIWTQWVLAGTSWQNFQGPAQVMKSVKDANGNWLYSEGCIDPELADAGEPDDPDGVPNMDMGGMGKKKKKVRALHEQLCFSCRSELPKGLTNLEAAALLPR